MPKKKASPSVVIHPPHPDTVALDFDRGSIDPMGEEFSAQARERYYTPDPLTPEAARVKEEVRQLQLAAAKAGAAEHARLEAQTKLAVPMVWDGTQRELGRLFVEAYNSGKLRARSNKDVLRQICQHFVDSDGKTFDPETLRVNLAVKQQEDLGRRKS